MPDFTNCTVTFTPPDYSSDQVMDALTRMLTGERLADFETEIRQNLGGKYDYLYEEETNAAK